MATRGITIWERHAEKFVVGIASAAAVLLAARQFIGQPNAVDAPGGVRVTPRDVDAKLSSQAEKYLARLDEAARPEVEVPTIPRAFDELVAGLQGPVSPEPRLALVDVAIGPRAGEWDSQQGEIEFAVPSVKPPFGLEVRAYADALTEEALQEYPDLAKLFPEPESRDIKFVKVWARLDLADLRRQFAGEGSDAEPVPASWYNDHPENIVDVVIEREELDGNNWTNRVTLEPIPGQVTFRPRIQGQVSASDRDRILLELSSNGVQMDVIQPAFYETVNGEGAGLPELDEAPPTDGRPLDREASVRRRLESAQIQRQNLVSELERKHGVKYGEAPPPEEDEPEQKRPPSERRDDRRGPPGAPRGGDMTPGGGIGKRGTGDYKARQDEEKKQRLIDAIKKLDQKIADLLAELRALRPDAVAELAVKRPGLADQDEVWIWAHDIHVDAGATYRYAVSVKVYNPFFGKKRSLVEAQRPLADPFALSSAPSDWSKPIVVKPFVSVFITGATPPGQGFGGTGDLGRATAEVWCFADGRWWEEEFSVVPGDHIGEVRSLKDGEKQIDVDFKTGLMVLDIIAEADADRSPGFASRSALVLLKDLNTGQIMELRDPEAEKGDPERGALRDKQAQRSREGPPGPPGA